MIFQIYVPDSLGEEWRKKGCTTEEVGLELVGLTDRIQSSHSSGQEEQGIIVSVLALLDPNHTSDPQRPQSPQTQQQQGQQGQASVIGRLTFRDGESGERGVGGRETGVWLSLGLLDPKGPLTLQRLTLDGEEQSLSSILLFHFDPQLIQYIYLLDLHQSNIPPIIIQGFTSHSPYLLNHVIPSLPQLDPCSKIDQTPHFQQDLYSGMEVDQEQNWGYDLLKRCSGIKQALHLFFLIKQVLLFRFTKLCWMNVVVMLMFDLVLGSLFTSYLLQFPDLYSTLHSQVQSLLQILLRLLNWLRGSPAGLKLNSALNSLLWRFFSYHLHLWANYIGILEPILSFMLLTIIKSGSLGFTVQISLIKDLLSMATFHVYCLYIYASRLFCVQLSAIKSLFRLFLGRKWNPLRNRVDHVQLSMSEMFLSALAFTIGIFLAPTTVIYYVVFLSLRLPVLVVESILIYLVQLLNSCEIVTNLLILANSPRVADEIYLKPLLKSPVLSFRICLQSTKTVLKFPAIGNAIRNTLHKILEGKVLSR